jgi:hypothetical protein
MKIIKKSTQVEKESLLKKKKCCKENDGGGEFKYDIL